MKKIFLLILAFLFAYSFTQADDIEKVMKNLRKDIKALRKLQAMEFPKHLQKDSAEKKGGELDINQYFTVLKKLKLDSNFVLDWVYQYDGLGGSPVLYLRGKNETPLKNYYELKADILLKNSDYRLNKIMNAITFVGDDYSLYQLEVLYIMANQFYLFWHACYNDRQIILDIDDLEDAIENSNGDKPTIKKFLKDAKKIEFIPTVTRKNKKAAIMLYTFTAWGGLFKTTLTIEGKFPTTIIDLKDEPVLEYQCGIRF